MKTKIRFLINTLAGGGAEKVLIDLLNCLDKEKYDIELVTVLGGVHESKVPSCVSYRKIVNNKNKYISGILSKIILKMNPKLFSFLFLRGDVGIDIAYLEGIPTRFIAANSKASKKVAFVHCDLSKINMIEPLYKNNDHVLEEYRSFSRVCFVSQCAKDGFEKKFGMLENGIVVHNVLDYNTISVLASEEISDAYSTTGIKFVTVGRLTEAKGYERLLRIVSEMEKKYEFELWIIGDGEERPKLEKIIKELDIRSVKMLGFKDNPYPYIKKADVFVCSSFSEGYSTAVSEAVALGIPVITTRCAGMEEILEDENLGEIVDNSEAGLKTALNALFDNKDNYEELKNKRLIWNGLNTTKKSLNEYMELFDNLIIDGEKNV